MHRLGLNIGWIQTLFTWILTSLNFNSRVGSLEGPRFFLHTLFLYRIFYNMFNPNFDSACNVLACESGYIGDPKVACFDVDECSAKSHTCHVDADCTNYSGGYKCTCKTGYSGDGRMCQVSINT